MKITHLWVVTQPTPRSTMQDICFETDIPHGLQRQYLGGLNPSEIVAFYTDRNAAENKARWLLAQAAKES